MPVVGKRYRNKRHQTFIVVESIKDGCITTKGFCKIQLSDFWHWFEELPEDNLQEKKEATVIFQTPDEPSLGFNSPTWSDVGTDSVDLEKGEVSEVEMVLEELEEAISKSLGKITCVNDVNKITSKLMDVRKKAQNLVNALEVSNLKPKIDIKEECVDPVSIWKDVNSAIKEEPKWLPISCAPKCGSVITVQEENNQRHKIFKAQWFLNKWYSLYKEGGNEEVNPEFWLEGSKEEPKTDIKEERVEPVSIWKDVSELPEICGAYFIKWKNLSGIQIGYFYAGNKTFYQNSNYNEGDELNKRHMEKCCLLTDFINSFEQMQKDIKELKKCKK